MGPESEEIGQELVDDECKYDIDLVLKALDGKPAFTKAGIRYVSEQVRGHRDFEGTLKIPDTNFETRELKLTMWKHPDRLHLHYSSLQALSERASPEDRIFPIGVVSRTSYPTHSCTVESATLQDWEAFWESCTSKKRLVEYIREKASHMPLVNRIVCFGLGTLRCEATYIQHLAACTIRDVFLQEQASPQHQSQRTITILAQDPAYCSDCKATLQNRLNIDVVEDPDGFLEVDANSFVMSIAPDVCVRQIVVDLTHAYGGPAGMLCNTIEDDGMWLNGQTLKDRARYSLYNGPVEPKCNGV